MTDYYIATDGSDSQTGSGIDNPYATVAGLMSAISNNLTHSDRLFFRAGTYTATELSFGGSGDSVLDLNGVGRVPSLFSAYQNEAVTFDVSTTKNYIASLRNVATTSSNLTYEIKGIRFEVTFTGTSGVGLLRFEQNTSDLKTATYKITDCEFEQQDGSLDITHGAIVCQASGYDLTFIVDGCHATVIDVKAIYLANMSTNTIVRNSTFINNAPNSGDSGSTSIAFFGARSGQDWDSHYQIYNNEFIMNIGGATGTSQLLQLDYINYSTISNNLFQVNPKDGVAPNVNQAPWIYGIRYANQTLVTYPNNKRNIKLAILDGNLFDFNHAKAKAITFYRSGIDGSATDAGSKMVVKNNTILGNPALRGEGTTQNLTSFAVDTNTSLLSEFHILDNNIEEYQDCIRIKSPNCHFVVEGNDCSQWGLDGTSSSSVAIALWALSDVTSATIRRNKFRYSQYGTGMHLADADSSGTMTVEDNLFVYHGPEKPTNNRYIAWSSPSAKLSLFTFNKNRYIGLDKLNDSTIFAHTTATNISTALDAAGETGYRFNSLTRDLSNSVTKNVSNSLLD